jgi:hypothetical protein
MGREGDGADDRHLGHLPAELDLPGPTWRRQTRTTGCWPARTPRRLEAEFVRDNALAASGLINLDIGGPSVYPYQPAGYYAALQFPTGTTSPTPTSASTGAACTCTGSAPSCTRCSRTSTRPPARSARRPGTLSSTPQQALTLLNDPDFRRGRARARGGVRRRPRRRRLLRRGLDEAFERLLDAARRAPASAIRSDSFFEGQLAYYRGQPAEAVKVHAVGLHPIPAGVDPTDARGLDLGHPGDAEPQRDHRPLLTARPMNPHLRPLLFQERQLDWSRRTFLGKSAQALGHPGARLAHQSRAFSRPDGRRGPPTGRWMGIPASPNFPPRAKRVIHLYMAGGPSHLDLLRLQAGAQPHPRPAVPRLLHPAASSSPSCRTRSCSPAAPPSAFTRCGLSGQMISDLLPYTQQIADDICIIRSMHTEQINHDPAHAFMNSGSILKGRPSMGSWMLYGLGARPTTCPGSSSSCPRPVGRRAAGLGPAVVGGIPAEPLPGRSVPEQGRAGPLRRQPRRRLPEHPAPGDRRDRSASTASTRRRRSTPRSRRASPVRARVQDADQRPRADRPERASPSRSAGPVRREGGAGDGSFASNCLLARRLAERGVRFIQLYHRGWDQHGNLDNDIQDVCRARRPGDSAALVKDLKQRGMLDDTLILWGGEFGRTPMGQGTGRDHHIKAFSVWLAGGGIKRRHHLGLDRRTRLPLRRGRPGDARPRPARHHARGLRDRPREADLPVPGPRFPADGRARQGLGSFLGHFHPVLVHLPIGILLLLGVLEAAGLLSRCRASRGCRRSRSASGRSSCAIGAAAAVLAAYLGWLLAHGGDYDLALVGRHQTARDRRGRGRGPPPCRAPPCGGSTARSVRLPGTPDAWRRTPAAKITHGSDYLTAHMPGSVAADARDSRRPPPKPRTVTLESAIAYADVVQPILQERCVSCHGPAKSNGGLRVDTWDLLAKGGKHGLVLKPGTSSQSALVRRIDLPVEEKEHMPPRESRSFRMTTLRSWNGGWRPGRPATGSSRPWTCPPPCR